MSVRAVAKSAYDSAQTTTITDARNAMVALLGDPNAEFSTMPESEVHAPPEVPYTLVVFADDDSDIHLGVRQNADSDTWAVWLVVSDGKGGWTQLGEQVQSLSHLWVLIDTWIPQWAAGVDYKVGDYVSYNGVTYKCRETHTSQTGWEPPNYPAGWVEVA
ncbi:MAG TPA: carbohydrate-binding protein [Acidimicrobiales bacterium]|nr:carbohydrate-binding protein [Acidimicrobiales bacterium]